MLHHGHSITCTRSWIFFPFCRLLCESMGASDPVFTHLSAEQSAEPTEVAYDFSFDFFCSVRKMGSFFYVPIDISMFTFCAEQKVDILMLINMNKWTINIVFWRRKDFKNTQYTIINNFHVHDTYLPVLNISHARLKVSASIVARMDWRSSCWQKSHTTGKPSYTGVFRINKKFL